MRCLSTTIITLTATVLLASGTLPATAANTCKSWGFVGQAVGPNQAQAKVLARANWAAKVTDYFSAQWANWSIATSRWEHCEPARRQMRCIANGVPCRPGLKMTQ